MKRLVCIILSICILSFTTFPFTEKYSAELACTLDIQGELLQVFSDNNGGFYLLCNSNGNYAVSHIDSDLSTTDFSLDIAVTTNSYSYFDNCFYFCEQLQRISNDETEYYLNIDILHCINGIINKKVIRNARFSDNGAFTVDNDNNIYIKNDLKIDVYSSNSIYKYSFELEGEPTNIITSTDGNSIFCAYSDGLAVINNENIYTYSIKSKKLFSSNDNYFSTNTGEVYLSDGEFLTYICEFNSSSNGVAVINDYVLGIDNENLTAYSNGEKFILCDSINNSFICSSADICGCFYQSSDNIININLISIDEIESMINDTNTQTGQNTTPQDFTFSSDNYSFNIDNSTVTGIEPSSTIAELKKNIDFANCTPTFYDYHGNCISSGNIGTGGRIDINSNDDVFSFSVIIYGDLSGEGNINTKDKRLLVNHLLTESELYGNPLNAGDVNSDNTVDLKDLVALNYFLDNNYTIEQKR